MADPHWWEDMVYAEDDDLTQVILDIKRERNEADIIEMVQVNFSTVYYAVIT